MPYEDGGPPSAYVGNAEGKVTLNGAPESVNEAIQNTQDAPQLDGEVDDFGLPLRKARRRRWSNDEDEEPDGDGEDKDDSDAFEDAQERPADQVKPVEDPKHAVAFTPEETAKQPEGSNLAEEPQQGHETRPAEAEPVADIDQPAMLESNVSQPARPDDIAEDSAAKHEVDGSPTEKRKSRRPSSSHITRPTVASPSSPSSNHTGRPHGQSISEWSHQALAPVELAEEEDEECKEGEWQAMPAFATHKIYDDWGKVLAKEYDEMEDDKVAYGTLGGAGKGYTRVQVDDDAASATSMDDNTAYLFKDGQKTNTLYDEDDEGRDMLSQMQATKELLTEGQRIAYVGVVRLSIATMLDGLNALPRTKATRKQMDFALEAMKMWGQKTMVRMYGHMNIDSAEQVMVEQLAEHGVLPADLTPTLMQNARVKNPAKDESETPSISSQRPSLSSPRPSSTFEKRQSSQNISAPHTPATPATPPPPPAYEDHSADQLTVQDPSQYQSTKDIDIDIRWTVLCDLFLLLVADSTYDARSRTLLEHVGASLSVDWQEVCRFEKRITDALEMQEQADKENWNEDEHLESRRKRAMKKRMMVMGLCTVGGGLIIGLSAGLLAPVIGAGLAAGFTTIGVSGTSTFLAGTGAAALIGSAGTVTGSIVGVRASNRRTGAVKTFEYRPLHNNKRTNLIVTVAGWMTGKVDDVRLPFSTVDSIMGDMYSVNWEPEMLQSTGQTIQILATEALTQTIQQVLASTILTGLMAGLSAPIVLMKLSYLIDNPWTVSLARADATGLILADSLIDRNLGVRPITLVGFSLGSRVIFSCLKELARRGAMGLIQNVYLFGSPVVVKKEDYMRARTVVSGRFVNGYATNDWILGYLFRATSGGLGRVSGLASVEVPGIENRDVTELVPGHMAYRAKMPALLQEVGWLVDGLEFNEIEDADPENHEQRQRELINEIEAARHVLEEGQGRDGIKKSSAIKSFFSRKKPVKRQWETYDERSQQKVLEGDDKESERVLEEQAGRDNVMFDVDAIRQEALKLALQGEDMDQIRKDLQVKEIQSTMPPLKVPSSPNDVTMNGNGSSYNPKDGLRQTRSNDECETSSSQRASAINGNHGSEEDAPKPPVGFGQPSEAPSSSEASWSKDNTISGRPPLRSIATAPAPKPQHPNHNPWSDDDESLFGKESNVQMSFE